VTQLRLWTSLGLNVLFSEMPLMNAATSGQIDVVRYRCQPSYEYWLHGPAFCSSFCSYTGSCTLSRKGTRRRCQPRNTKGCYGLDDCSPKR
jgi:hypothetical protein